MNERTQVLTVVLLLGVVALLLLERFGVILLPLMPDGGNNCPETWTPAPTTDAPTFADLDVVERDALMPATPAGEQLAWVLQTLHGRFDVTEDHIREHFAPSALEALPAEDMIATLSSFREHAPLGFIGLREGATELGFSAVFQASPSGFAEVLVHVTPEPPHRMTALLVQPYDPASEPTPGPEVPTGFGAEEPPSASASVDRAAIQGVVNQNRAEIQSCYEAVLQTQPELRGVMNVTFRIGVDGSADSASAHSYDFDNATLATCMAATVQSWTFPVPADGQPVSVTYPFVLAPE